MSCQIPCQSNLKNGHENGYIRVSNHGKGIVSTKPEPNIVYDFLGLNVCYTVL